MVKLGEREMINELAYCLETPMVGYPTSQHFLSNLFSELPCLKHRSRIVHSPSGLVDNTFNLTQIDIDFMLVRTGCVFQSR